MAIARAHLHVLERRSRWSWIAPPLRFLLAAGLASALLAGVSGARALSGVGGADPEMPEVVTPAPSPMVSASPSASLTPTVTAATPTVSPPPEHLPPVAEAGGNQVVNPGELVVLDGHGSFGPKGARLTYQWRQVDGVVVILYAADTANPSFRAGRGGEVYIFSLTVRDRDGAVASDTVVVSTREQTAAGPEATVVPTPATAARAAPQASRWLLSLLDGLVFIAAALGVAVSVVDRFYHALSDQRGRWARGALSGEGPLRHRLRVVHYETNEGIAGARVEARDAPGAVVARRRAGLMGAATIALPPGVYTLAVSARGFSFSPPSASLPRTEDDLVYSGGQLRVADVLVPLSIVIPMKPVGAAVGSLEQQVLKMWQVVQRTSYRWSWPVMVSGALLNTALMLWLVSPSYLVLELLYLALVVVKIVLSWRLRPSFGLVKDAITHLPIGLAVVRLHEAGTNRLVLTRVTDDRGQFFATPPPGTYTVVVSKQGYATFARDGVVVSGGHDLSMSLRANLMPVVPHLAGAAQAV